MPRTNLSRRCTPMALLAAVLIVGLLAGCSNDEPSSAERTRSAPEKELVGLDPSEFEAAIAAPDAFVVNVHIPYEGEIDGTDAFIPFDQIVGHTDLPQDRGTPVVLYCRSGNMSEEAGAALIADGYENVSHLDGGMNGWQNDGRDLTIDAER